MKWEQAIGNMRKYLKKAKIGVGDRGIMCGKLTKVSGKEGMNKKRSAGKEKSRDVQWQASGHSGVQGG